MLSWQKAYHPLGTANIQTFNFLQKNYGKNKTIINILAAKDRIPKHNNTRQDIASHPAFVWSTPHSLPSRVPFRHRLVRSEIPSKEDFIIFQLYDMPATTERDNDKTPNTVRN